MSLLTSGMIGAGTAALLAGLFLVRTRFAAASGAGKILVLGPSLKPSPSQSSPQNIFWQQTVSQPSCRAGSQARSFGPTL